jgi:hypothetical protein
MLYDLEVLLDISRIVEYLIARKSDLHAFRVNLVHRGIGLWKSIKFPFLGGTSTCMETLTFKSLFSDVVGIA